MPRRMFRYPLRPRGRRPTAAPGILSESCDRRRGRGRGARPPYRLSLSPAITRPEPILGRSAGFPDRDPAGSPVLLGRAIAKVARRVDDRRRKSGLSISLEPQLVPTPLFFRRFSVPWRAYRSRKDRYAHPDASFYPPALIANQLADLDRATNWTLTVSVGVGGEVPAGFFAPAGCRYPIAAAAPMTPSRCSGPRGQPARSATAGTRRCRARHLMISPIERARPAGMERELAEEVVPAMRARMQARSACTFDRDPAVSPGPRHSLKDPSSVLLHSSSALLSSGAREKYHLADFWRGRLGGPSPLSSLS
jgi:hypothetical protein